MKTLGRIVGLFLLVGTLSSFDTAEKSKPEIIPFNGSTTIKKTISSFEINDMTIHKVQVKISDAGQIMGIAKYEDLIPAGFTVSGVFSDLGNATFDSEKAEVTFLTLKGHETVTITYFMHGELPIQPVSESKFMFLNGDVIENLEVQTVK